MIHNFDGIYALMTAVMALLQRHFKEETDYSRPLLPPQANILFTVDDQVACRMVDYISQKLVAIGGFKADEFRFTHKSSLDGSGLQRLRLEFQAGVTTETVRRIEKLKQALESAA